MTTYKTTAWGCDFEISANFAEASCPVIGDDHGRQVADFRHCPQAAMRSQLEECADAEGGDCEDPEAVAEIEKALDAMTESDA